MTSRLSLLVPAPMQTTALVLLVTVVLTAPGRAQDQFRRGDADGNGNLDIADAILSLTAQFVGSVAIACEDALDVNDNESLLIDDPLALLFHLFAGGTMIPAPGPERCGLDPSGAVPGDSLGCTYYPDTICSGPSEGAFASFDAWLDTHIRGPSPTPLFSFVYNGAASSSVLPNWNFERLEEAVDADRTTWQLRYADPSTGLTVTCEVTTYSDHAAAEWVLFFENTAATSTPIIEDILPANLSFESLSDERHLLYYSSGSTAVFTDFEPFSRTITSRRSFSSFGGRSSDGFLPYFNLRFPDTQHGAILGVGWTGDWKAAFNPVSLGRVDFTAGMQDTHFRLLPGERVRSPAILMLFWEGADRIEGQNRWRSLLRDHYTPTPSGNPVDPPILSSVHGMYSFDGGTTEANMVDFANKLSSVAFPVDGMWIDAGWYNSVPDNMWVWTGTWEPHSTRFPNGLGPVATRAHERGYEFLLWHEPERVMKNSSLAVNHPEWLLTPTSNLPASLLYLLNDGFHLLDFGNPEALAWAKQTFSGMIGDVGIDIYRHDCNILPSFYWNNNEPDDRRGIREIRHVTGLYEYFDTLLADHPDLLIDNVASGGRRMDFEMLRRSLVLTRTDFLWNSDSAQSMTHALSQWVPWTGLGTISVNPYDFRSGLGAHFVTALNHNSSSTISAARSQLLQHRQIRHLYSGDFYPLTSYSTSNRAWIAWQYHRADLDEGFVQIFRRAETPVSTETFEFKALDPNATYALTNWDIVGAPTLVSGAELLDTGITLSFPTGPKSAVIVYERR